MKSLIKQRVPVGLWRAFHHLRSEWRSAKAHRRGLKAAKQYRNSKAIKINIGCGPNPKPGWLNLDIEGADLTLDMREIIPLPDKCAQMIYSEHFFEHLDYPGDAMRFLRECRRLLSPGGIFSVGVPDTEWPLRDYVKSNGYLPHAKHWHPGWCSTKMEHINYHFRQDGEHLFAWDFETMEKALCETGFSQIRRRDFNPSLDTQARAVGTLYVDAVAG